MEGSGGQVGQELNMRLLLYLDPKSSGPSARIWGPPRISTG